MTAGIEPTVRASEQDRYRLITLKGRTGIKTWYGVIRPALAVSLSDPAPPLVRDVVTDSSLEIAWGTFGGRWADVWLALLQQRAHTDGLDPQSREDLQYTLNIHVARGIGRLTGNRACHSPEGMARLVLGLLNGEAS